MPGYYNSKLDKAAEWTSIDIAVEYSEAKARAMDEALGRAFQEGRVFCAHCKLSTLVCSCWDDGKDPR